MIRPRESGSGQMKSDGNKWMWLGSIGKPFGLKGSFYLNGRDDPLPTGLRDVVIAPSKPDNPTGDLPSSENDLRSVLSHRLKSNKVILTLSGIDSPEQVRLFSGQAVYCKKSEINLEPGEYLWVDLVGLMVEDDEGCLVGEIRSVENYGATDIVTIIDRRNSRKLSIPLVPLYVDMSFAANSESIRLVVSSSTFDDSWEEL